MSEFIQWLRRKLGCKHPQAQSIHGYVGQWPAVRCLDCGAIFETPGRITFIGKLKPSEDK